LFFCFLQGLCLSLKYFFKKIKKSKEKFEKSKEKNKKNKDFFCFVNTCYTNTFVIVYLSVKAFSFNNYMPLDYLKEKLLPL
jgi:hypothetical protein